MTPLHRIKTWPILSLAVSLLLSNAAISEGGQKKPRRTTGHSIVDPGYQREKLPNGGWKTETYAFGIGEMLDPTERDESLTELTFEEMAGILAKALLKENYAPATDPEKTDLVIVVNWGKTIPHSDGIKDWSIGGMSDAMNSMSTIKAAIDSRAAASGQQAQPTAAESSQMASLEGEFDTMLMMQSMSDRARREANDYNARLLGYAPQLYRQYATNPIFGPQRSLLDDMVAEIETPRYFVILQAYDFQKMWKNKEKDLLWITRFSIRAKGRRFDEEIASMASAASSLFGTESGRLKRHLLPGKGEMGELEVVDVVDEEELKKE